MESMNAGTQFDEAVEAAALDADNQLAEALSDLTDEISNAVESAVDDAVRNIGEEVASEIRDMLEERFDGRCKFNIHDLVVEELKKHREKLTGSASTQQSGELEDLKQYVLTLEDIVLAATDPSLGFLEMATKVNALRERIIRKQCYRSDVEAAERQQ